MRGQRKVGRGTELLGTVVSYRVVERNEKV